MVQHVEDVVIGRIVVEGKERLPIDEQIVNALVESIKNIGLLEPIIVWRSGRSSQTVFLVAGRHRLEACKRLKLKKIRAVVEEAYSSALEQWRILAEIDENLIRRKLTDAQRAELIARRKKIYELMHPETLPPHKGGPGSAKALRHGGAAADRFTLDAARNIGRSERTIQRDARRGEILGAEFLRRIAGTSLDKGIELDALVNMDCAQRDRLAERAQRGEQVSALNSPEDAPLGYDDLLRAWAQLRSAWQLASGPARQKFMLEIAHVPALSKAEAAGGNEKHT